MERKFNINTWIGLVLLSVFILPTLVCAQANFDKYFDKGEKLLSSGSYDEAIVQFEKAAQENPKFAGSYLNIGVCYLKADQLQKAIDAFVRVTKLFPNDWRGHYQLAFSYGYGGKISKSLQEYNRAKELGIQGKDDVGELLAQYQPKEFSIESERDNKKVTIKIKGNPSADKVGILDTIRTLEGFEIVHKRALFNEIRVEFIQYENKEKTLAKEKWTIVGPDGQKEYSVEFNFAPPSNMNTKTLIHVSDKE